MYPVNPRGGELDGYKVYRSVDEIPENIDYAICTVSAKIAPEIVRKCAAKGARAVHFCTAGFAETGGADVTELQQFVVRSGKLLLAVPQGDQVGFHPIVARLDRTFGENIQ